MYELNIILVQLLQYLVLLNYNGFLYGTELVDDCRWWQYVLVNCKIFIYYNDYDNVKSYNNKSLCNSIIQKNSILNNHILKYDLSQSGIHTQKFIRTFPRF